jgi:ParB family chromosome partitioning protein
MAAQIMEESGQPRKGRAKNRPQEPVAAIQRVQNLLTHRLSTRVSIQHGEKKGHISIEYYGSDDLNRILGLLGVVEE